MSENKLVEKKIQLPAEMEGAWGTENTDASDILIPKLLLMQGLSKRVVDEQSKMGDMVNSVTGELLGDKKTPVEIIPISSHKTWIISEKVKDKYQFKAVVPFTPENAAWPMEETVNGIEVRRDRVLNFFVLNAKEASRADALPYVLSFRRTGYRIGQKLATHFAKCRELKAAPASKTFKLSCSYVENDKGKFYVFDVAEGRTSTKEEVTAAYKWYKNMQAAQVRVDESDLKDEATEEREVQHVANSRF